MERAAVATPLGVYLVIGVQDGAVVASDFRSRATEEGGQPRDPVLREAVRQARAYFRRRLHRFDLPLALHGSAFQEAIWRYVSGMETGQLISYSDLARAVGHPRAYRAAAAAMVRTPLALFVPAHRVVGNDGRVRGAGRRSMRRRLLAFEGIVLR